MLRPDPATPATPEEIVHTYIASQAATFDLHSQFSKPEYQFQDDDEDHSAQFRATNMTRHEYWRLLLDEFIIY